MIDDDDILETYLNLYTHKRSSLLQSSVIAFLAGIKLDEQEKITLRKIFTSLDTNKDGFLSANELCSGMKNIKE